MEYGLFESSSQFSNKPLFLSYVSRSKQIDGVWVSLSLLLASVSILPYYFREGDYCESIINFLIEYLLDDKILVISREM